MPKHKTVGGRKSVRIRKVLPKKAKPIYNSDEDIPDEASASYHKDDIDIHHEQLEEDSDDDYAVGGIPEAKPRQKEAVYDFSDSDDEEEMEKRLRKIEASVRRKQKTESSEEEDDDHTEEDYGRAKAWGKKRDDFYGADVTSKVDVGVSSDDDEAEAKLEEKEARQLQQKLLSQVDESDYGLDMFREPAASTASDGADEDAALITTLTTEQVAPDLSTMSADEKLRLLNKKHPEFMNIVTDYKAHLTEYTDKLAPILDLHKRKIIPDSSGLKLMRFKAEYVLNYCSCCQFYLLLIAEKSPVEGHPVIKRMVQFKKTLQEITKAEERVQPQIDLLLRKIAQGKEHEIKIMLPKKDLAEPAMTVKSKSVKKKSTKMSESSKDVAAKPRKSNEPKKSMQSLLDEEKSEEEELTGGEKEALEFYNAMSQRRLAAKQEREEDDLGDDEAAVGAAADFYDGTGGGEDEKRAITEEMQKNRGLTAKRPKGLKNPRIKNKLKYLKKKKIHKSIVPPVLRETNRYSGEVSGIRAGRIRSVALS